MAHMNDVRKALLATLKDLRESNATPADIARAKAVAQVASVLVDSARVEVEFLRATETEQSTFLAPTRVVPSLSTPTAHNPFPRSLKAVNHDD